MGANNYPLWSPDGKRIAYDTSRDGDWSIYIMDADGSRQMRLTPNDGATYWAPLWRHTPVYLTNGASS
jgi:TolB protein